MLSPSRSPARTAKTPTSSPVDSHTPTILNDEESTIEYKAERDEGSFEARTGNDPQDPLPSKSTPLPFLPKPNTDPSVVTWDGPNDPSNPQNWSLRYKWWLTIVCIVMTLNVYASLDIRRGPCHLLTLFAVHLLLLRHPLP